MNQYLRAVLAISTLAACSSAFAGDAGSWLVRLRAIDAIPKVSSSTITGLGGNVTHVSNSIVPELDISYFFNSNISSELILATTRHKVEATGTALGLVDLGKVNLLPPTLTVQYHFTQNNFVQPYVGVGANFTHFFNVDAGPTATSIHYGNSFGPAFQIGTDFALGNAWSLNLDVKKVYVSSNVDVHVGATTYSTKVKLNPMILGLGVGYRFC